MGPTVFNQWVNQNRLWSVWMALTLQNWTVKNVYDGKFYVMSFATKKKNLNKWTLKRKKNKKIKFKNSKPKKPFCVTFWKYTACASLTLINDSFSISGAGPGHLYSWKVVLTETDYIQWAPELFVL